MNDEQKMLLQFLIKLYIPSLLTRHAYCTECGRKVRIRNRFCSFEGDNPSNFFYNPKGVLCSEKCARLYFAEELGEPGKRSAIIKDSTEMQKSVWRSLHRVSREKREAEMKALFGGFSKEELQQRMEVRRRYGLPARCAEMLLEDEKKIEHPWVTFSREFSPATQLALELFHGVKMDPEVKKIWEASPTVDEWNSSEALEALFQKEQQCLDGNSNNPEEEILDANV